MTLEHRLHLETIWPASRPAQRLPANRSTMRWTGSRLPLRPRALSVRDGERQDACGRVCEPPDCSEGFTEGSMDGSPGPLIGSRNTVTIRGWGGPLARVHRPSRPPPVRQPSHVGSARVRGGSGGPPHVWL